MLVTAVVGYTVITLAAQVYWGVERWTHHGEAFSVYYNMFARMSVFETRDGVLGCRRPLGGLPKLDVVSGTVPFVCVMIGTVTFDGLSPGAAVEGPLGERRRRLRQPRHRRADRDQDRLHRRPVHRRRSSSPASTGSASRARARSAAGSSFKKLEHGFIHSLVPIAAVYVAAHYLTFLVFEGQAITYLASDPFGQGWDLFGTVDNGINYTVFPQEDTWYVQVAVVVIGHVAALALAHDRALSMYRDTKLAVRSQYWMLGVMVGFTSLALWLLAQAA